MEVLNLGLIDYKEALDIQLDMVGKVIEGAIPETLIVCHHPRVVTLGKKSEPSDLNGFDGKVYEISRGGRVTYHGPGQVVIYPIINLKSRNNDIYKFLRSLEEAMVNTLGEFGISGAEGDPENTGVWVSKSKIASIGIAIKRWVTYHGLAINIYRDDLAFKGINPCGMDVSVMTNLEELIGRKVERNTFENSLAAQLSHLLSN